MRRRRSVCVVKDASRIKAAHVVLTTVPAASVLASVARSAVANPSSFDNPLICFFF